MGEQSSEVLDYVPAHFKVLQYMRETWSSTTGQIVTAPVPNKMIEKGIPGPGLLTQVVLSKYRDHCPLTRQTRIYARSGVVLSRNTLVDCDLLTWRSGVDRAAAAAARKRSRAEGADAKARHGGSISAGPPMTKSVLPFVSLERR